MCIFQRASIGRRQRALFERLALDLALGDWDPRDLGWGEVVFRMGNRIKATALSNTGSCKWSAQSPAFFGWGGGEVNGYDWIESARGLDRQSYSP